MWEKQTVQTVPQNEVKEEEIATDDHRVFVTNVDPDVNHWQTKETEFFTIKFPKEWYWMESDLKETGYHSQVITNNPDFDINKYADISLATSGSSSLIFTNATEIIVTMNGLGWPTTNSGTPHDFMKGLLERIRAVHPLADCYYVSELSSVPLTAFCSYGDVNNQDVQNYYTSYADRTFAFTARKLGENRLDMKLILEQIAKSRVRKENF